MYAMRADFSAARILYILFFCVLILFSYLLPLILLKYNRPHILLQKSKEEREGVARFCSFFNPIAKSLTNNFKIFIIKKRIYREEKIKSTHNRESFYASAL